MGEPNIAGLPMSWSYTAPFGKEAHLIGWVSPSGPQKSICFRFLF